MGSTHNINTAIPRNSDHGVEGTEVDTDYAHLAWLEVDEWIISRCDRL
jgi:hypothetical protein